MHFVGWSATNREAGFLWSNGISARGERMAFQKIPEKNGKNNVEHALCTLRLFNKINRCISGHSSIAYQRKYSQA